MQNVDFQIGAYSVESVLARGGAATVYSASSRLHGRVALKVLEGVSPEAADRFVEEHRRLLPQSHPNLLKLYDCGVDDARAWVAMRLADGTLRGRIESSGPLDPRLAARVLTGVANALDYLHENGLVHLDVKPANVLLVGDWALLGDFGTARAALERPNEGRLAGTPAYMAPEQWRGGAVDGRADQYALGLVAYELLTGRRPFAARTIDEHSRAHLTLAPGAAGLGPAIDAALLRALAKTPDDRFSGCGEMAAELALGIDALCQSARRPGVRGLRALFRREADWLDLVLFGASAASTEAAADDRLRLCGRLPGSRAELGVSGARLLSTLLRPPMPTTPSAPSPQPIDELPTDEQRLADQTTVVDLRRL